VRKEIKDIEGISEPFSFQFCQSKSTILGKICQSIISGNVLALPAVFRPLSRKEGQKFKNFAPF
jgi:hypothetical protein